MADKVQSSAPQNGERLRILREAVGWTQSELAGKIGQTAERIAGFESGKRQITASELWAICGVLNKKPYEFFEAGN